MFDGPTFHSTLPRHLATAIHLTPTPPLPRSALLLSLSSPTALQQLPRAADGGGWGIDESLTHQYTTALDMSKITSEQVRPSVLMLGRGGPRTGGVGEGGERCRGQGEPHRGSCKSLTRCTVSFYTCSPRPHPHHTHPPTQERMAEEIARQIMSEKGGGGAKRGGGGGGGGGGYGNQVNQMQQQVRPKVVGW